MRLLTVRFFAAAADAAGTRESTIEVPDGATLDDALQIIDSTYPRVTKIRSQCTVFIDDMRTENPDISNARTLDILPPFAGG